MCLQESAYVKIFIVLDGKAKTFKEKRSIHQTCYQVSFNNLLSFIMIACMCVTMFEYENDIYIMCDVILFIFNG